MEISVESAQPSAEEHRQRGSVVPRGRRHPSCARRVAVARRGRARTASSRHVNAPTPASATTRTSDAPRMSALSTSTTDSFETQVADAREWFAQPRFEGIVRLHTARDVAAQQGTIQPDYTVARTAAEAFHARLRELFAQGRQITTFGPYSPGQAVVMKRMGIEAIYLGGWATSAKGSAAEDPGPDLASYPLGQVPDEAAGLVRALLTADKNQSFARARMDEEQRRSTPEVDYRPFIVADADTGHGGDAHVRNLVRRFVEAGVPGLSHRGPEAGRQEVRPSGRQGPRRAGRAEQATQRRTPAARHHAGARDHRRAHRRRIRDVPRRSHRRAGPALHPRGDERRPAELSDRIPGDPEDPARSRAGRGPGAPPVRGTR